ncbi:phosphoribosyltransferase [Kordiimonas marina]|uniref:phosphoribosyltransferase n=1 Tax=Kordiimonas marina TaxID=2872312 RepID=UPI001FF38EAB|nr:phosphoribosyltransferase [Kordiimonas marina]MCJ9428841.1 phosphoribosyltransferase [Kordiimonas marina]
MHFRDRTDAGQQLADALQDYQGQQGLVLLALPRGGVPVAVEVAKALKVPLDVMLVRKLGVPGQEELAMGAIAMGGTTILNDQIIRQLGLDETVVTAAVRREMPELARRNQLYRGGRPMPDLHAKTVIVVDDGLATGATMKAAVAALRKLGADAIIVAVPVGAYETCEELAELADTVICLYQPSPFWGVGRWYQVFGQTSDQEVIDLLGRYGPDGGNAS